MIRKPVLTAMGLLSYLREILVEATVSASGVKQLTEDSIGCLATVHKPDPDSDVDRYKILADAEDLWRVGSWLNP